MRIKAVEGHDRIGTAVRLDEIPPAYKKYPVIGRGATSIVLDYDATHVLIFTRDQMKKDWLQNSLEIGQYQSEYDSNKSHIKSLNDKPIMIIKAKKLKPLSKENKKKVKEILAEYMAIRSKILHSYTSRGKIDLIIKYDQMIDELENEGKDHPLDNLIRFLSLYSPDQYEIDLHNKNFMQTDDGKLVVLDPVIDKEIIGALQFHKIQRNKR